jgi:hypothetical protein
LNTDPNGPALREKVPAFLSGVAGLGTTAIEGNENIYLITASSFGEVGDIGSLQELIFVVSGMGKGGKCLLPKGLFQHAESNRIVRQYSIATGLSL